LLPPAVASSVKAFLFHLSLVEQEQLFLSVDEIMHVLEGLRRYASLLAGMMLKDGSLGLEVIQA